jgi:predicted CopG family antitoxin/sulfur relay (sulfurtransferase) DsrC/TusE family protein
MKQVKVSDDVYDKLKQIAEKNGGISLNDVVKMLLNLYLGGSSERTIDKIVTKEFIADSEKICSKCKRKINVGEPIYWVKYIYSDGSSTTRYFCMECVNPHLGKIYRKKKEMEIIIKQLKQEADKLVEEINQLEQVVEVAKVKKEVIDFWRAFSETFSSNPDFRVVEQFLDKFNELLDKVNKLEATVKPVIEMIKGKTRKKEMYREGYLKEGSF